MRISRWALLGCLPLLLLGTRVQSALADDRSPVGPPRADAVPALAPGKPASIEPIRLDGSGVWPQALRERLAQQILVGWDASRMYGPLAARIPVWLNEPLMPRRLPGGGANGVGDRVSVAVASGRELLVSGRYDLPVNTAPRRVVVLIDASASSNAPTLFVGEDGSVEHIPVIQAEYRALEHLLERLEHAPLELGLVAFGEGTLPIAPPGASLPALREQLESFRETHPAGEGRTDLTCALWTAWDWLSETPKGVERELVILTDGDLPHSGRFERCDPGRSDVARRACEARQNRTVCPASRRLRQSDGGSDAKQLERLASRLRRKVAISPIVFEADRAAHLFRGLAETTGGTFTQVPSVQAIERVLPHLVVNAVQGVYARNLRTGHTTDDLRQGRPGRFGGSLPLAAGPNDVEVSVEGREGTLTRLRFRVFSAEALLDRYLADLRRRNRALEQRQRDLVDGTREHMRAVGRRRIDVHVAETPAADAP